MIDKVPALIALLIGTFNAINGEIVNDAMQTQKGWLMMIFAALLLIYIRLGDKSEV